METLVTVVYNFISAHFSKFIGVSVANLKTYFDDSVKLFLSKIIYSSLIINFFCISISIVIYELASQYDKNQTVRLTSVLIISITLTLFTLYILIHFLRQKKLVPVSQLLEAEPVQKENAIEQALAILILEFAKDKDFARQRAQNKTNFEKENQDSSASHSHEKF